MRNSVVLPEPDGPSSAISSPDVDLEVDVVRALQIAEAFASRLLDVDGHVILLRMIAQSVSSSVLAASVTSASSASSDATANEAANWYSL